MVEGVEWGEGIESEIVNELICDWEVGDYEVKNGGGWVGMDLEKGGMGIIFEGVVS